MKKQKHNYLPLLLERNRVWRTYHGGKLLDAFQGKEDPADSEFPEEWIASVTRARNTGREHIADEGLSRIAAGPFTGRLLTELIEEDPEGFLGSRHHAEFGTGTALLAKFLDSSERLTIQVHPDYQAARDIFASRFGKIESWYVMDSRPVDGEEPYILFGFKPGITRRHWRDLFEKQDIAGMIDSLHRFPITKGDVFLIPGGLPHAIGPGCFFIEVQEPTDYSIRPERITPKGNPIPDQMCHQGAGFDRMFDIFHYDGADREKTLAKYRISPRIKSRYEGAKERILIDPSAAPFSMNEVIIDENYTFVNGDAFAIWIVIEGEGQLAETSITFKQADEFFVPQSCGSVEIKNTGQCRLRLIVCRPPSTGNSS
jgi:mannose-6-phosphate isomerase